MVFDFRTHRDVAYCYNSTQEKEKKKTFEDSYSAEHKILRIRQLVLYWETAMKKSHWSLKLLLLD